MEDDLNVIFIALVAVFLLSHLISASYNNRQLEKSERSGYWQGPSGKMYELVELP